MLVVPDHPFNLPAFRKTPLKLKNGLLFILGVSSAACLQYLQIEQFFPFDEFDESRDFLDELGF